MTNVNAIAYAQLIYHMLDGTMSCKELAEVSGLTIKTVRVYTRALYKAGAVHINGWEKDCLNRDTVRLYKIGSGKDARRELLSRTEQNKRYSAKRMAKTNPLLHLGSRIMVTA